jgi:carbon storage regulator
MLVLTRKLGEEIQIGAAIRVTVLAVTKSGVKLGITGPREIPVVRTEIAAEAARIRVPHIQRSRAPLWHSDKLGTARSGVTPAAPLPAGAASGSPLTV